MAALDWLATVIKDWRQMPLAILASILGVAIYLHFQPQRIDPWKGKDDRKVMEDNEQTRHEEQKILASELKTWVVRIRDGAIRDRNAMIEAEVGKQHGIIMRDVADMMEDAHESIIDMGDMKLKNYLMEGKSWARDYIAQNVPPPEMRTRIKYLENAVHELKEQCARP